MTKIIISSKLHSWWWILMEILWRSFAREGQFFFFFRGIVHGVIINVFLLEKNKTNANNTIAAFYVLTGWLASYKFLNQRSWGYLLMVNDTMFSRDIDLSYSSFTCRLSCLKILFLPNMFLFTYHGGILWILCWPIIDHKGWSFLQILALVLLAGSKA